MTDYRIERLGHLGDGIAPGPVYAPRTLPGEVVMGQIDGDRLTAVKIVAPSPDRVRPPCPRYGQCGGCALMHAADGFVADWKVAVVVEALAAQGLSAQMRPIAISAPGARRRATLSGRRLKSGALVGFHGRGSDMVVGIDGCLLLDPRLLELRDGLSRILPRIASRKAEVQAAVTVTEAGMDIDLRGAKPATGSLYEELVDWAGLMDLARLSQEGEALLTRRPPIITLGGVAVTMPPGAFLQATPQGEATLQAAVADAVGDARRIADLFAGMGTFALPLSRKAEVHAVEGANGLTAALDRGWRQATGLHRITTETRDLFRRPLLPDELNRFAAVVIDPPRAGAEAQMMQIAASSVARVAAVSCNPVTFARDARCLVRAGFTLDWVQVVDQFRWSPHVELAAQFSR